jgi:hypothetical protein
MVDFRHASQTQYRGCCTSAWLPRALLDKLFANLTNTRLEAIPQNLIEILHFVVATSRFL